ncbi:MAG: flap endonuclease-1 [Candidatus Altiarchaeales archaeon]|nr:MAG: flap endonuclease-1 [Candidatus Altiarchaeales archaeon]RLI94009.1 MAG: flap endonuclease-1 [Candidatus Altiarchaeales archaeon]RLI94795.1 MAG: flap endonuclease-1 [Candidatus Altiarchaeales archaeon]
MGVNLRDIVPHEPISFYDLKGKVIAIDALNSIYQFLSIIRQPDGTPLMDSHGRITSHLSGLLYRTTKLVELGIRPVYVFDGKPPELKRREIMERDEIKREAELEWQKALDERRLEDAIKFAKRTSRVTDEMLEDSKKLLEFMGIPYVQAPSEGEAQCSHMCKKNDAFAVGSQDYDALLFGAPRIVRGLTLSGKLELEIIHLDKVLNELNINMEKLIDIAILIGTDFNEGIKGIGPKKALRIIRDNKLSEIEFDFDIDAVRRIFLEPEVTDEYKIEWSQPDENALIGFLCREHNFSEQRVKKASQNLKNALKEFSQRDLSAWF